RRGVHAPDLHQAGPGPADAVLRDHRAAGVAELRQGELQGALRGDRAGAGGSRYTVRGATAEGTDMAETPTARVMTSDELFALPPNKKVDRWLFRGELRESKATKRNPHHSGAVMAIGEFLRAWLKTRPMPRGKVYGGEAYFRLRKDPDTNVGIDV